MDKDQSAEIERLKQDFYKLEQESNQEKECLLKIINSFGMVMATHEEFAEEFQAIKKSVNTDKALPVDLIEKEIGKLRSKVFTMETSRGFDEEGIVQLDGLKESLLGVCRIVKRITVALLDDFYPLSSELKATADSIQIDCHADITQAELEDATVDFLSFIKNLKVKIAEDFRYINNTLLALLDHVKKLEKDLTSEFDEDVRQKEIEQFEITIHDKVGSIVDSFNIHATIEEIKSAVVEKLAKIKNLISLRKKKEMQRIRKSKKNINRLRKRIVVAEREAGAMTQKAKYFQTAATIDGLTGLSNRNTFDLRVKSALKTFDEGGKLFSIVLFDVDDFKNINDTFGHLSGDKVLQKIAQCLQTTFRKNDCIARFGGDEFAVVVEGLGEEMARERIMKFEENFRKKRFYSRSSGDIKVAVSAGFAQAVAGEGPEDILRRADMDMYALKKKKH
ncbi:MAG: GGDEF domain-containing protein [Desulfobacterales bacterium]|uniref:diguanylate cyclase n=1 Tax=Candidatus Desulfatibia vada TaxID=2841696 RepID=A0A8J6P023_9BACT|nr:GGDEF domain-containing protein [Candidatus Desulfatibia vada]